MNTIHWTFVSWYIFYCVLVVVSDVVQTLQVVDPLQFICYQTNMLPDDTLVIFSITRITSLYLLEVLFHPIFRRCFLCLLDPISQRPFCDSSEYIVLTSPLSVTHPSVVLTLPLKPPVRNCELATSKGKGR